MNKEEVNYREQELKCCDTCKHSIWCEDHHTCSLLCITVYETDICDKYNPR